MRWNSSLPGATLVAVGRRASATHGPESGLHARLPERSKAAKAALGSVAKLNLNSRFR